MRLLKIAQSPHYLQYSLFSFKRNMVKPLKTLRKIKKKATQLSVAFRLGILKTLARFLDC